MVERTLHTLRSEARWCCSEWVRRVRHASLQRLPDSGTRGAVAGADNTSALEVRGQHAWSGTHYTRYGLQYCGATPKWCIVILPAVRACHRSLLRLPEVASVVVLLAQTISARVTRAGGVCDRARASHARLSFDGASLRRCTVDFVCWVCVARVAASLSQSHRVVLLRRIARVRESRAGGACVIERALHAIQTVA